MATQWRSFSDAHTFVQSLELKTWEEWNVFCKSEQRPADIPTRPDMAYGEEFLGVGDWLGTGTISFRERVYRPFVEARSFVQALGFTNRHEWKAYCRSGQRPSDVPTHPENIYKGEWKGWGDFLGTGNIAPFKREFFPFEQARTFVHSLGLRTIKEWKDYCASGQAPEMMPHSPQRTYKTQWQNWSDWLGNEKRPHQYDFLSFEDAIAFVHGVGLHSVKEWHAYCLSPQFPSTIPTNPNTVYSHQWKNWSDWLGTNHPSLQHRSFEEARAFVHTLGLKNAKEWKDYCASGRKPADIPSVPGGVYRDAFRGMGDWVGTGRISNRKREFLPFEEARTFARSLHLTTKEEWDALYRTGQIPPTIPKTPEHVYCMHFRGWWDWLGVVHQWKKAALIALLQDLQPTLPMLSERELYVILEQGGALPALRIALGEKEKLPVLRRIMVQGEQVLHALQTRGGEDVPLPLWEKNGIAEDDIIPETCSTTQQAPQGLESDSKESLNALTGESGKQLHLVDHLAQLTGGLDDEAAEYLVANRVSWLWEIYSYEGQAGIDRLLIADGDGPFFTEISRRFRAEVEAVEDLDWREGWAFTADGRMREPNKMQCRIAWMVQEHRRVGNWSGVGAGKTISAILSSRVCGARLTLIITNYSTVAGWTQNISNVYPDSRVSTNPETVNTSHPHCYLVLNYEKFQGSGRHLLVQHLLTLDIMFMVLDEIQLVKQRDTQISQRSKAVEELLCGLTQANPAVRVLGMSATPMVNSLTEAKRLLEMTTGRGFPTLGTTPTIANALMMHRTLLRYGYRFRPRYEQEMQMRLIKATRNDLFTVLEKASSGILAIEQALLLVKLELVASSLHPGTLIYTQYLDGILLPIQHFLREQGFSMGCYTGEDKSGLPLFLEGHVELLIGSSAIGTGIDGLQFRCDRIIFLSLPWTAAAFEQVIGRVRRQGSRFQSIEIVIPQIVLQEDEACWSWDDYRWKMLHLKKTLADCVIDGCLPEMVRVDEQRLLQQSHHALQEWIKRVKQKETAPGESVHALRERGFLPDDLA